MHDRSFCSTKLTQTEAQGEAWVLKLFSCVLTKQLFEKLETGWISKSKSKVEHFSWLDAENESELSTMCGSSHAARFFN